MFDGVRIDNMVVGGPAHSTNLLQKGDIVEQINEKDVNNKYELHSALSLTDLPGGTVLFSVRRPSDSTLFKVPIKRMVSSELPAYTRQIFGLFTLLKVISAYIK